MPEKKHQNPFEDHINSETFDMSRLSNVPNQNHVTAEIQAFVDGLPQPLSPELWEQELDDRQKLLCEYLTDELVENVMRVNYAEELQDITDAQLTEMLIVPVAMAMLAEEHLHIQPKIQSAPKAEEKISTLDHPNAYPNQQPLDFSGLAYMLRMGFLRAKHFFQRVFRKRR